MGDWGKAAWAYKCGHDLYAVELTSGGYEMPSFVPKLDQSWCSSFQTTLSLPSCSDGHWEYEMLIASAGVYSFSCGDTHRDIPYSQSDAGKAAWAYKCGNDLCAVELTSGA